MSTRAFSEAERCAVYRAIAERRDMRHFAGGNVPPEILTRLLNAAHHAPSVGLMQPWRFVRITDIDVRRALHGEVEQERVRTAEALGERSDEFMRLKVEGVLECAELLVVALMERREQHIFGRRTLPEMDVASVACAIQNMWLAARAEGFGLGWVSLFDPDRVAAMLAMPEGSRPLALLCLGPVDAFYETPMLIEQGWAERQALNSLVYENAWGQSADWPSSSDRSTP